MCFQIPCSPQDINCITLQLFQVLKCFYCLKKLNETFINEILCQISVIQLCQKFVVYLVVVVGVIEGNLLFFVQCCVSYRRKKAYFLPYIRRYATLKVLVFSITLTRSSLREEFVVGDNFVIFSNIPNGELLQSSPFITWFPQRGNI